MYADEKLDSYINTERKGVSCHESVDEVRCHDFQARDVSSRRR